MKFALVENGKVSNVLVFTSDEEATGYANEKMVVLVRVDDALVGPGMLYDGQRFYEPSTEE